MIKSIIGLLLLFAFALRSAAQDEIPTLDATYCSDGLRFNYPSVWEQPRRKESSDQIIDVILTNYHSGPIQDDFYLLDIQVHEEKELLKLFPDSDDHALPLMDELYRRYSDTFANATLEDLVVHTYGDKLLILNLWNSGGEEFNTLYDSGFMITAGTVETGNYYDWRDTAISIIDTITYDPDAPCPSETTLNISVTNARDDGDNHYYASPAACATIHWNVTGTATVYITDPNGETLGAFGTTGELRTIPLRSNMIYTVYAGGRPGEVKGLALTFQTPASLEYPGNQANGYIDPSCE